MKQYHFFLLSHYTEKDNGSEKHSIKHKYNTRSWNTCHADDEEQFFRKDSLDLLLLENERCGAFKCVTTPGLVAITATAHV